MSSGNINMANDKRQVKALNMSDVEMIFGTPDGGKKENDGHSVIHERRHNQTKHKTDGDTNVEAQDSPQAPPHQPLLEPDRGKQKPPLAGPEIDDLDDEKPTNNNAPFPGIDDGLLEPGDKEHKEPHDEDSDLDKELHPGHGDGTGTDEGKWWLSGGQDQPDHPYDINSTRFDIEDRLGSPLPSIIPDINTYQQKKNLAQGMMDLALFTANANQLRYVIETSNNHPYYYFSLVSITCSIVLQIAVGVGLILNSRYNVKDEKEICKADKINNMTILGIFLITIVNVFITAFSVAPTNIGIPAVPIQQTG